MYTVYLGKVKLPVTPEKITMKIKNQNKTLSLIDGSQVNILKQAGLTDITFDALIPQVNYSFARYKNSKFRGVKYFLGELEKMKQSKKPVQFVVWREMPGIAHGREKITILNAFGTNGGTQQKDGKLKLQATSLFDTNITVSVEDYDIKEDFANGFDLIVSISLKQYVKYGTKLVTFKNPKDNTGKPKVEVKKNRGYAFSILMKNPYKVKKNDSLKSIARRFYDDELWADDIYKNNKKVIEEAAKKNGKKTSLKGTRLYAGTVLKLPMGDD